METPAPNRRSILTQHLAVAVGALVAWVVLYQNLARVSHWLTYQVLHLPEGRLASALEFFVFEAPKVLLLLAVVVFFMGIVRSFFSPERTRAILAGKRESVGNVLAALLGVVTPLLFMLGSSFVYWLRDDRRAFGGNVFFSRLRPDG